MSSVKIPNAQSLLRIVKLTLAERAIYTELEAWLVAKNMNALAVKNVRYMSDRDERIHDALSPTKSGELGLLRAASGLELDATQCNSPALGAQSAVAADFRVLLELRKKHQLDLQTALKSIFEWTEKLVAECPTFTSTHYHDWVATVMSDKFEDHEAATSIIEMKSAALGKIKSNSPKEKHDVVEEAKRYLGHIIINLDGGMAERFSPKDIDIDPNHSRLKTLNGKLKKPGSDHRVILLREFTPFLSSLASQFVNGLRACRYLNSLGFLHESQHREITTSCRHLAQCPTEVYVLSVCGHTICRRCFARESAEMRSLDIPGPELAPSVANTRDIGEVEVKCIVSGCKAHMTDIRLANDLVTVGDVKSEFNYFRGSKINDIVRLINKEIPQEDQVIVFVQDDLVMKAISEALAEAQVSNHPIYESIARSAIAGKCIKGFRLKGKESKMIKVLLLNSANESCAGS